MNFNNFEKDLAKINDEYDDGSISGVVLKKLGNMKEYDKDALKNERQSYIAGAIDEAIIWSDKYKQYIVISRK